MGSLQWTSKAHACTATPRQDHGGLSLRNQMWGTCCLAAAIQPWHLGVMGQWWHTRTVCYPTNISLQASPRCVTTRQPRGSSSSFWQLHHRPDGWPGKEHSPHQRVRQPPSFEKCCQTFLKMLPYLVASSCICSFLWFPCDKLVPIRSPHIRNHLQQKRLQSLSITNFPSLKSAQFMWFQSLLQPFPFSFPAVPTQPPEQGPESSFPWVY